jgi:DNA helicase-2/ATP-dependent DNA helicase PcrA
LKELLKELNSAQLEAVENTEGPVLILAGAGSGKTRTLTYRIAYILRQRLAAPWQILALTFTNKAAREMRSRIENLIGSSASKLQMGTFHSVFSSILRKEAAALGYTPDFTIYDEEDAVSLISAVMKELNLDDKKYKPKSIKHFISGAKNHLVNAANYNLHYLDGSEFTEIVGKIFRLYEIRCKSANAMDFDDLLVNMAQILEENPTVCEKYQQNFKYILVDEYQDTNHAQYRIIKRLAALRQNICVVGDDSQSIYSFRGATIENILNFQKDYPSARIFRLEENYRSTQTIVGAANHLIAKNESRLEKNIFTNNERGELIRLIAANSEYEEAEKIVDWIREQKVRFNYRNQDFAILYRTNAQSRALEDGLRRRGIKYRIFGGMSFYQRKEIKDIAAYLRLAVNPQDETAARRVINYPARGVGEKTIEKIAQLAQEKQITFWNALKIAGEIGKGKAVEGIRAFVTLIEHFQQVAKYANAYEAVDYIAKKSGILKDLSADTTVEGRSRWDNVQELINAAQEFTEDPEKEEVNLALFLNETALYTDLDKKEEETDVVTLMTVHASKGLEFTSVFVAGMEEKIFPSLLSSAEPQQLEEERRLFYVAITRAQKHLCLSYAQNRYRFGRQEACEPSRFLSEIKPEYIQSNSIYYKETTPLPKAVGNIGGVTQLINIKPIQGGAPKNFTSQAKIINAYQINVGGKESGNAAGLAPGCRVIHEKFGYGTILGVEGEGEDIRVQVDFQAKGRKTLMLKYARLQLVL